VVTGGKASWPARTVLWTPTRINRSPA
jgi:hypothetical protein